MRNMNREKRTTTMWNRTSCTRKRHSFVEISCVPQDRREDLKNDRTESQTRVGQRKLKRFRCGKIGHIAKECRAKYPANSQVNARQVEDNDKKSVSSEHVRENNAMLLNTVETVMFNRESII